MQQLSGTIIHSISGFYYVEAAEVIYECKARGQFRKAGITPLSGDNVEIEIDNGKGVITEVKERKNSLTRPPVANIDRLFIISSADKPKPNRYIIDKLTVFARFNKIEPVLVFSKSDLCDVSYYVDLYKKCGFTAFGCSSVTGDGMSCFEPLTDGVNCAFTGNSGVGKSSILNYLCPTLKLETNEISDKLGRGKHTTRSVRLYKLFGGYIADTPGFSSIDAENMPFRIYKEELSDCFPEFAEFTDNCKFGTSCSHTCDKGCAVIQAVKDGLVSSERHESYCKMYADARELKKWE